jgi:hypothetical protein
LVQACFPAATLRSVEAWSVAARVAKNADVKKLLVWRKTGRKWVRAPLVREEDVEEGQAQLDVMRSAFKHGIKWAGAGGDGPPFGYKHHNDHIKGLGATLQGGYLGLQKVVLTTRSSEDYNANVSWAGDLTGHFFASECSAPIEFSSSQLDSVHGLLASLSGEGWFDPKAPWKSNGAAEKSRAIKQVEQIGAKLGVPEPKTHGVNAAYRCEVLAAAERLQSSRKRFKYEAESLDTLWKLDTDE